MFLEYGDDSVAQLGGVHLACEQASNLLTKILEWGRLMAYLEQSTRYIPYDTRLGGRYRYLPPVRDVLESPLGTRYIADIDALFDTLRARCCPRCIDWARERYPKEPGDSDFVYKQTIKAKACDAVRGILPAATLSNVGIYGTGQALRGAAAAHARAPAARGAAATPQLMLDELRKVIPSFLDPGRPPRPRRRVERATSPRPATHTARRSSHRIFGDERARAAARRSRSPTSIPTARTRCSPRSATRTRTCPRTRCSARVRTLGADDASRCCTRTSGSATTGGTSPAARSSAPATASTCSATTARSATCSVTACSRSSGSRSSPRHGYEIPEPVAEAGLARRVRRGDGTLGRALRRAASIRFPEQAPYAVSLAYRMRFVMQMNAREAMHLLELRTAPQGHPSYRQVAPGDAPADRRAGRPPRDRGGDALRRPRRRTSSSGSPPSAPRRPVAPPAASLTASTPVRSVTEADRQADGRKNFTDLLTSVDARRCRSRRHARDALPLDTDPLGRAYYTTSSPLGRGSSPQRDEGAGRGMGTGAQETK